jgi:hypothetical protein
MFRARWNEAWPTVSECTMPKLCVRHGPIDGLLTVTFAAKPGSRAGAVYDVRLLAGR